MEVLKNRRIEKLYNLKQTTVNRQLNLLERVAKLQKNFHSAAYQRTSNTPCTIFQIFYVAKRPRFTSVFSPGLSFPSRSHYFAFLSFQSGILNTQRTVERMEHNEALRNGRNCIPQKRGRGGLSVAGKVPLPRFRKLLGRYLNGAFGSVAADENFTLVTCLAQL